MKNYVGRIELFLPMTLRPKYITYGNGKYRCKNTGLNFNVKTAHCSKTVKSHCKNGWIAIWLDASHKKGISSCQLARDIEVTQKTAWFMLQLFVNVSFARIIIS